MTRMFIGTEKELLLAFLDQEREVVLWKLEGLTDDQLRQRRLTPSGLYLLGLVKHLAAAEQYWLCQLFARPAEPLSLAASDDVELEEGDTTDSVLAYYARARAASRSGHHRTGPRQHGHHLARRHRYPSMDDPPHDRRDRTPRRPRRPHPRTHRPHHRLLARGGSVLGEFRRLMPRLLGAPPLLASTTRGPGK
jgi:Protein of unknown function (DUF664)